MPTRKVKKFKIGDVVRIKGDRKLARVFSFGASPNRVKLDRKLKGMMCWNIADLIRVSAAPVPKVKPRHSPRVPAKISKNKSSRLLR